jgi:hypothetical protein
MAKKVVSSGSAFSVFQIHRFFPRSLRRGPCNDIQIVQRIAWTNVSEVGLAEHGTDIYE